MKEIPLTQGKVALVDDEDYERLIAMGKWSINKEGYVFNAKFRVLMHRFILNAHRIKSRVEVDHMFGNKLDNRKSMIRLCSSQENSRNRGRQINNKSGFKGVVFEASRNKFKAQIQIEKGVKLTIGRFNTIQEAARAYNAAAIKYHGEFANLNPI